MLMDNFFTKKAGNRESLRKMHGLGVSTRRLRSFDAYELTMDRPYGLTLWALS